MIKFDDLKRLNHFRNQRQTAFALYQFEDDTSTLYGPDDFIPDHFKDIFVQAHKTGKAIEFESEGKNYFLHPYVPNLRLFIIGAVHISQALVVMSSQCGYDITIIDPREAFASPARFPNCALHTEWPTDYFKNHPLDKNDALIALTHNPDIDDGAIIHALKANAFYVGALGSRKTHEKRKTRLLAQGLTPSQIDKIHAPIGLDIEAITPAEIAVSILSQLIFCYRTFSQEDTHAIN